MQLFARYFQCSKSELPNQLSLDSPSLRVRRVAQQLYEEGLVVDAGSLLLKLQDFHPTLNAAVVTLHSQTIFKLVSNDLLLLIMHTIGPSCSQYTEQHWTYSFVLECFVTFES